MNIRNITGNIVPVPGIYKSDRSLDLDLYANFVKTKVSEGNHIFYLANSASEFKYMGSAERLSTVEAVCKSVDLNEVTVLCQPLGSGSIESQIDEGKAMQDHGATALVVMPPKPVLSGKFFSCHYDKAGFNKVTHGEYYVDYIQRFASELSIPIVFHDAPLSNNLGLPIEYIDMIMETDGVHGIKVHSPDPCAMQTIYSRYSESHLCFDGFGKTMQFWSLVWGAQTRHTCWSWFDSSSDQNFYSSVVGSDHSKAVDIINREWLLAMEIKKTGFAGYKELMRINELLSNNLTRVPGLSVTSEEAKLLSNAYDDYKKIVNP